MNWLGKARRRQNWLAGFVHRRLRNCWECIQAAFPCSYGRGSSPGALIRWMRECILWMTSKYRRSWTSAASSMGIRKRAEAVGTDAQCQAWKNFFGAVCLLYIGARPPGLVATRPRETPVKWYFQNLTSSSPFQKVLPADPGPHCVPRKRLRRLVDQPGQLLLSRIQRYNGQKLVSAITFLDSSWPKCT